MIIFDTDAVSALMRLHLEPEVETWLKRQQLADLFTTAPTVFELKFWIDRLPAGRRRQTLQAVFDDLVAVRLKGRILSFDKASATVAGEIRAFQIGQGRNVSPPDSQIAGIARSSGATIATRNTRDFVGLGIPLVDPWAGTN